MADARDPVVDALRALAAAFDEDAPPVPATAAIDRPAPHADRSRQRLALVGTAAVFVVLAGVLAWTSLRNDDPTAPVTPPPGATSTSTSTTAPTIPTTAAMVDGRLLLDFGSLPEMGILVRPANDPAAPVELYGLDGVVLGHSAALPGTIAGPGLVVWPDRITPELPGAIEVPAGCQAANARGGVRIALCGGEPQRPTRVERFDPDGRPTLLLDALSRPDEVGELVGYWRRAMPSPDGRWVLVQWSGECEASVALFVDPTPTGSLHTLEGGSGMLEGGSGSAWAESVESTVLGWAPDGRAVIVLGPGLCGRGVDVPGVYLVDPDTLDRELVVATPEEPVELFLWEKRTDVNELEHLAHTALIDLGLEVTGGERSHGDDTVSTGVRFDGYDIGVYGAPSADAEDLLDIESSQRLPLLHGEATALRLDSGGFGPDVVAFRCGANTWWLSWREPGSTPEVDSMLLLAEALVPYLGCTLRPPPE